MIPGHLNKIITIQQRSATTDASGGEVFTWADVAVVWAAVLPIKGRELIVAEANRSELTTTFRIRYRSGIDSGMRIVYASKYYDIKSVVDPYERHEELHLLTGVGLNDG